MQQKQKGISVPMSFATREEFIETIKQKIKEGPSADPNYQMLLAKLVDPDYGEEKEFIKQEISEYRVNQQCFSNPIIQSYLIWLQKDVIQAEHYTREMLFSNEKIDLYIRDQDTKELIDLTTESDKNYLSRKEIKGNFCHIKLKERLCPSLFFQSQASQLI